MKKHSSEKAFVFWYVALNAITGGLIGYSVAKNSILFASFAFILLLIGNIILKRVKKLRGIIDEDEFIELIDLKSSALSFKILIILSSIFGVIALLLHKIEIGNILLYLVCFGLVIYLIIYIIIKASFGK